MTVRTRKQRSTQDTSVQGESGRKRKREGQPEAVPYVVILSVAKKFSLEGCKNGEHSAVGAK